MDTKPRVRNRAVLLVVAVVLAGTFPLSACGSSLTDDERVAAEVAIYSAVARQFVESTSAGQFVKFGGGTGILSRYSEVLIVNHIRLSCSHNGVEWKCSDNRVYSDSPPVVPFTEDIKSGISTAIKDIAPPFRFIGYGERLAIPSPDGVVIRLGAVVFDEDGEEDEATVRVHAHCGSGCETVLKYRVIEESDTWVVAETLVHSVS